MPLASGQPYASVTQFFGPGGLPSAALGALTTADVQDCLVTSTSDMDDCFRGVYGVGFVFASVGASVSRRCVEHAKWLLMRRRGDSPETGSDQSITRDEADFQVWIDKVQRRVIFPDVTLQTAPLYSAQPFVSSNPSRGWEHPRTAD